MKFALFLVLVFVIAGQAAAEPQTGTFKISLPGYSTQIFVSVPSNYKSSQSSKWGLIVGLHGAGQPAGSYLGAWPARLLGNAGYVMVSPQSCTGGGVWNIDGKGDNAKECEYILKIVEKLMKEYDLNPDMIHVNGFSAGSGMCGVGVSADASFRKFKQKSLVGFSGGFSAGMKANTDKAKETKVRIYNGTADTPHKEPSQLMYQAFKDSGYDAEHIDVPGKGHTYPLVNHKEIIDWYGKLDKAARKKGEYVKLAGEAQEALKEKNYPEAQKLFEKLQKTVGEEMEELAKKAKEGLGEIEKAQKEAVEKIEELKAADKKDELTEFCKQVMKEFAKMEAADKAKDTLKELSKSSRPPRVEPEKTKPEPEDREKEPEKDNAAGLLTKAKRCIENEAYEAARNYLEKIIRDYPDSPESSEAKRLLEKIEDEF